MREKLEAVLTTLEKTPMNIWAVILIAIGATLVLFKHEQAGTNIISGGLFAFQHKG